MLHNAHKMEGTHRKSDKETTCKLYPNKYNVCIIPFFCLPKINSSEGIFVKHRKDCVDLRGEDELWSS